MVDKSGKFKEFEEFLEEALESKPHKKYGTRVFVAVKDLVEKHTDGAVKEAGMQFLSNMFRDEKLWGESVLEPIIHQFRIWKDSGNAQISLRARKYYGALTQIKNPTKNRKSQYKALHRLKEF